MVDTFGIRDVETIAKRLGTDIDTLKHKVHSLYTYSTTPTIDDVTSIITYLANEEFENYIALCDDVEILKIMSTQYAPILDYEDNGIPTNEYTIIIERIKELGEINNMNNHTYTLYIPTATQANEKTKMYRQTQVNDIVNVIKPVVEREINNAIDNGMFQVNIVNLFGDKAEASQIKSAIIDYADDTYNEKDFKKALDIIANLLKDKGYSFQSFGTHHMGLTIAWTDDIL